MSKNLLWNNILTLSPLSLCVSAQNLVKAYPKDLEPSLQDELFSSHHIPCNSASHQTKELRTGTVPRGREVRCSWIVSQCRHYVAHLSDSHGHKLSGRAFIFNIVSCQQSYSYFWVKMTAWMRCPFSALRVISCSAHGRHQDFWVTGSEEVRRRAQGQKNVCYRTFNWRKLAAEPLYDQK